MNRLTKLNQRSQELLEVAKLPLLNTVEIEWLAPYCRSTESIVQLLQFLGFEISKIVNETFRDAHTHQWVETTAGFVVYVNNDYSQGCVAPRCTRR